MRSVTIACSGCLLAARQFRALPFGKRPQQLCDALQRNLRQRGDIESGERHGQGLRPQPLPVA